MENCTRATLSGRTVGPSGRPTTFSTGVSTSPVRARRGRMLHVLAAKAMIRDWDEGCYSEVMMMVLSVWCGTTVLTF